MPGLLSWLFGGRKDVGDTEVRSGAASEGSAETAIAEAASPALPGKGYFKELDRLSQSISDRDYQTAADAARASLPYLRDWLKNPADDQDRLDIRIPALAQGGTMMAIMADRDGLSELRNLVQEFEHLVDYREVADTHFDDLDLFNRIRRVVRERPGTLQNRIKAELGIEDGRRAARLVAYLEKNGEIRREVEGRSYRLFPAAD